MKSFTQLKKNLKRDCATFKTVRIALLGDTATQFLVQAIKGCAYEAELNADVWEADFNQIDRQIFDPESELFSFQPEIVILFQSSHKLLGKFNKFSAEEKGNLAQTQAEQVSTYYSILSERLKCKVIFYNLPEIDDCIFGSYATKIGHSFIFQLRRLNMFLMEFAQNTTDFYLCDLSFVQNLLGKKSFFQPSIYVNTEMVLSLDALPYVAYRTIDIISALNGKFKKCLILDLDNTLWGGVIGDDGIENIQIGSLGIGKAFTEFQYWIKALKQRGIILAVCSKNTESVAKEPFEKHPDMVLRLDDISVFMANWETKVDNIRHIQRILNIGFDSMVFLDDNPFERNIVRENIPEICVPELPEDPAEYLEQLYSLNLFETVSVSADDEKRTQQYQTEAKRVALQQTFVNENEFLQSLNMQSLVEGFTAFNTPRVAQLTQRSNQFNLRTVRYTEGDVKVLSNSDKHFCFAFSLADKFGDHGLISVVILEKENNETLFIDTWLMSCRVLKRGMENFVTNILVEFARENGFAKLKGEYLATAKNEMVKDHYLRLGFEPEENHWIMTVKNYQLKECFITKK